MDEFHKNEMFLHMSVMRGSKDSFQNLKMVAGSTSSCLCRIICVFFCTSVAKSANDGRSLKKAIFVFDIPGEKERTKTFYTQWKNFFL
jgi:hypothetical protein